MDFISLWWKGDSQETTRNHVMAVESVINSLSTFVAVGKERCPAKEQY